MLLALLHRHGENYDEFSCTSKKKKNQRVHLWKWMAQLEFEIMCSQWANIPKIMCTHVFCFCFILFVAVSSTIPTCILSTLQREKIKCVHEWFINGLWWNEMNWMLTVLFWLLASKEKIRRTFSEKVNHKRDPRKCTRATWMLRLFTRLHSGEKKIKSK